MTIAKTIIKKFGGVRPVAEITGRTEATVYRWTYDKEKGGTGGYIPSEAQRLLVEAAKIREIDVKPADFFGDAA